VGTASDVADDMIEVAAVGFSVQDAYDLAHVLDVLPQLFENLVAGFRELGTQMDERKIAGSTGDLVAELAASMGFAQDKAGEAAATFRHENHFWLAERGA
jgi:hypothetical protein